MLLNSRAGSTALRACFASGISGTGNETEDVLCAELETSARLLEADDKQGAGLELVLQLVLWKTEDDSLAVLDVEYPQHGRLM